MRRLTAIVVVCLMVLTGCGTPRPGRLVTAEDQAAVILASFQRVAASTLRLNATVTSGPVKLELSFTVDPATETFVLTGNAPEPIEVRAIADTMYIKQEDQTWLLIDVRKLKPTSQLRQFGLEQHVGILGGIISARRIEPGRYEGVADLRKAVENAPESARDALTPSLAVAKNSAAVPFEVSIDAQGRLTGLSFEIVTAAARVTTEVNVSEFGVPLTVTPPPAHLTEAATDFLYEIL